MTICKRSYRNFTPNEIFANFSFIADVMPTSKKMLRIFVHVQGIPQLTLSHSSVALDHHVGLYSLFMCTTETQFLHPPFLHDFYCQLEKFLFAFFSSLHQL